MKAVAADAVVMEAARQGEPVGELRMGAVEGGIEAGDLGQVRLASGDRADAGEVVRLMQRGERAERLELGEHGIVDPHRGGELGAAVDHPVAHAPSRMSPRWSRSQSPSTRKKAA